jgi:hypothetical protein
LRKRPLPPSKAHHDGRSSRTWRRKNHPNRKVNTQGFIDAIAATYTKKSDDKTAENRLPNLLDFTLEDMQTFIASLGKEKFRAPQISEMSVSVRSSLF